MYFQAPGLWKHAPPCRLLSVHARHPPAQAYADMGAPQRAHLLAEDFVGALVVAAHRIVDRGIPRDVHPPEQLALFRAISVLMRRHAVLPIA